MKHPSLRIAMISEHASPLALAGGIDAGGQNVYVAHTARCLAEAGHHVDVLTRRDAPDLPAAVSVRNRLRVMHLDGGPAEFVPKEELLPHMAQFTDSARRLFAAAARYDVIHAHFFMSGEVGLALRQRFGVPLVTSFHALGLVRREHQCEADHFPAQRIDIERRLAQQSDRLIAACPQDEADLLRLYGANPARMSSVPCGVDTQLLRPGDRAAARRRLQLPQHEFIVLQLGRMVPRKGIDNVVRAVASCRDQAHHGMRLLVVGGGSTAPDEQVTPEIGRLRRLAHELGVGAQVQFLGRRAPSELRDLYLAADVFVTTPWYEPFGITPLEAMACGTPVIGSAVGGIKHTVVDGVTGYLVPPHDPGALSARLMQLQDCPALGAAMGRAGVRRVRSMFTWDEVASQLADVYRSVQPVVDTVPLRLPHALHPALARSAPLAP